MPSCGATANSRTGTRRGTFWTGGAGGTPSWLHSGRLVHRMSSLTYSGSAISVAPATPTAIASIGIWS
jgi:hypothetical protein